MKRLFLIMCSLFLFMKQPFAFGGLFTIVNDPISGQNVLMVCPETINPDGIYLYLSCNIQYYLNSTESYSPMMWIQYSQNSNFQDLLLVYFTDVLRGMPIVTSCQSDISSGQISNCQNQQVPAAITSAEGFVSAP